MKIKIIGILVVTLMIITGLAGVFGNMPTVRSNQGDVIDSFDSLESQPTGLSTIATASWSAAECVSTESYQYSGGSLLVIDNNILYIIWCDSTDLGGCGGDSDVFYKYRPITGSGGWINHITEVISMGCPADSGEATYIADNGKVYVAWTDLTDFGGCGGDSDIFFSSKPSGGTWGGPLSIISSGSSDTSGMASLAVHDGTIHVVWFDDSNYDNSGIDRDIFYSNSINNGATWSKPECVFSGSTGHSLHPHIVVDSSDIPYVTWVDNMDYNGCGGDSDIFFSSKPSGGTWGPVEVVSTGSTSISFRPELVVENGIIHITWHDLTNDYCGSGSDTDIFYRSKTTSGGTWGPVEVVSTSSTGDSWDPSLAVENGAVHIVWSDNMDYMNCGNDFDIFYNYKPSGGTWGPVEVVTTESTNDSWVPSLKVDNNAVHITWTDETDDLDNSGSDTDIFYKKRTAKWEQHPGDCTAILIDNHWGGNRSAADDFLCTTTGSITNITLWGSSINNFNLWWLGMYFNLSIYSDNPDPDGSGPLYSKPDTMLWTKSFNYFGDYNQGYYTPSYYCRCLDGFWYDPYVNYFEPHYSHDIYQFDFNIHPCDAFIQNGTRENPVVYWLVVYARMDTMGGFCWEASQDHWNDDAVYKDYSITSWLELRYPTGHPNANESIDMAFRIATDTGKIIKSPNPPIIAGSTSGKAGTSYTYTFTSTDPDRDDVYYFIEWGDGDIEDWFGPFPSGETATAKHVWDEEGTYTIRAKAKDTYDAESDWATLSVSMPKNKPYLNTPFLQFLQFLENFFEKYPNAFPVLRYLLRL